MRGAPRHGEVRDRLFSMTATDLPRQVVPPEVIGVTDEPGADSYGRITPP